MNDNGLRKWFAIDVVVDSDATEAVESALNTLDSLGNEIDSFRRTKSEPHRVTGYFDMLPNKAAISFAVNESLTIHGIATDAVKSIDTRTVVEIDWLAEWKKYWKPTVVGQFVIAPPWETVDDDEKMVIRIEPNMAFGTGTHETTQLCLQAISDDYSAGQTFLDVGTGTGILAIAVAKMFIKAAISAYETDADSVAIAKENAILNTVGERIEFVHGPISDETPIFDFVCANLTIDVIVSLLPLLIAKARQKLVLSGILVEQKSIIAAELEKFKISNFKFQIAGEWMAAVISME